MELKLHGPVPGIIMEDDLGITYLVENVQQFWSELEDIVDFESNDAPTLSFLDSTLRRFVNLCAAYHEQYLQSPFQLEHACNLVLDSELFQFHSERMCEILVDDLQSTTDPHIQLISYDILLSYGRRRSDFFRSNKRWQPLLPLLMDHILVEMDPDVEDTYSGVPGGNVTTIPVPIEAKLRTLSVRLLYEVCRVQKLSSQELRIFDDAFIDYLFDLVEETRSMQDETFNYCVIKLIIALNEQYMVAALPNGMEAVPSDEGSKNRILRVLMRRLGSSKTFGENMIFMLNRAGRTPDDLCVQLLVLKTIYVLFTTSGTSEYFYTNDLCVLVDVFLRELVDLDEESESLRHTYLRVLHPLLTKTQLREIPYKRPQIVYALESLIANGSVRDINPTTRRLVERCLGGDWCVNVTRIQQKAPVERTESPTSDAPTPTVLSPTQFGLSSTPASAQLQRSNSKALKSSKSVENLRARPEQSRPHRTALQDSVRRPNNSSSLSLPAAANPAAPRTGSQLAPRRKATTGSVEMEGHLSSRLNPNYGEGAGLGQNHNQFASSPKLLLELGSQPKSPQRRSAPPPPPKRRKPPAIPTERTNAGATIMTIRSSASAPLSKSPKGS